MILWRISRRNTPLFVDRRTAMTFYQSPRPSFLQYQGGDVAQEQLFLDHSSGNLFRKAPLYRMDRRL
jgi:hypothetical protein